MSNVKIDWHGDKVKAEMDAATERVLTAGALDVHRYATEDFVPVVTGRLKTSINWQVDADEAVVGTNVEYAKYIEFGHSKKAPNGFLRPALDRAKPRIQAYMRAEVKKIRGG